mgnify:FL=1
MNLLTQIKHKTQKGEEVIMDIGAKASNVLPENFVEQKERSNLAAKDKLPVIFGKLSKWYADLRPVAWSGSYSDLTNKPTIPEGSAANYQVANNDTTEAEGFVADARIVRTHGLEIDGLSRELGTGGGEMSLKSMVSELYGKLANFDLVVDISKYFSTNTAQIFEVKSSADLSGYEYIAICATFQKGKSGNFTEIAGCEILDQLGWNHPTSSDEVAIHLVILKNITGAISILGRYAGTGSATVKAFGFK